jgi:hypothetical protein
MPNWLFGYIISHKRELCYHARASRLRLLRRPASLVVASSRRAKSHLTKDFTSSKASLGRGMPVRRYCAKTTNVRYTSGFGASSPTLWSRTAALQNRGVARRVQASRPHRAIELAVQVSYIQLSDRIHRQTHVGQPDMSRSCLDLGKRFKLLVS